MKEERAVKLVEDTFRNRFSEKRFLPFIKNFLNEIDQDNLLSFGESEVPSSYGEYVKQYKRIGQYKDPEGEVLDVLTVNLKRETSPKRARTMQRNFIGWYLKNQGYSKDNALVAFYHEDIEDWRFSYVKRSYRSEKDESGKISTEEALTPPRRFSFLVGQNEPSHTAQNQIVPILENDKDNPTLSDIEKAFNVEIVTDEFFKKYRDLFLNLKDSLDEIVEKDQEIKADFENKGVDTVDFAKKLLSQIVFLYFLQKKGWLGVERGEEWGSGSKRFLRELFSKRGDKNFFNDILEPLFYEALRHDRRVDDDYYYQFDCKIPFLNGGLFDPINNYSWVDTDIYLPDALFSNEHITNQGDVGDGILDIFDRYNFTVKEDEPLEREVAVDPEMLGKVFENLLGVRERKSKGTYYTPREIVHYMCQESLINYLSAEFDGSINRNNFEKLIKNNESFLEDVSTLDEKFEHLNNKEIDNEVKIPEPVRQNAALIDRKLSSIRICDPAVGSGAFVVGMMNEIAGARIALTPYLQDVGERTSYNFKRDAIQDCLYGVDIDSSAVEIAKLRLWLSLIVDEKKRESIQPLPNLDYKIVNGNSLLNYPYISPRLEKIEKLKTEFFGETHPSVKRQLRDKIDKAIMQLMENTESSLGYKINFDFKIFFSEIFHKEDGFDVVIGNPPYVKEYENKSAFDGLRNSPYYKGKMDIWHFFVCKSIDILKRDSGTLSFIAQSNWPTNFGALKMRDKVIRDSQIITLIDFGDFKIFDAGIQTMIMLFKRSALLEKYTFDYRKLCGRNLKFKDLISVLNKEDVLNVEYLTPKIERSKCLNKELTFSSPEVEKILNKLLSKSNFRLTDEEVANGIHHHYDRVQKKHIAILGNKHKVGDGVFVLSDEEKKQLQLTKKELELVKPCYTTEQLSRWQGNSKNKEWVIYTDSSFKHKNRIKNYPNLKKHLDQFERIITSDNKPYGLHRARKEGFFKGEKIVSVRKCAAPTFTYVDFDSYVSAAFYVIKTNRINQKYLTAILNSKLIDFWLKHKGKRQGSNYQIDKQPIIAIPLLTSTYDREKMLTGLVDEIIAIKKDDNYLENTSKQAKVAKKEKQIDQLVYKLYRLTGEEIRIVENTK